MPHMRQRAIEGLTAGDIFSVSRTYTEQDMIRFSEVSRDYNPVHWDQRFARVKKFDKRICHGLLVASLITEIGGQIGWLASEMNFKFKKPVYFGDTITCDLTITDIDGRGRAAAVAVFKNLSGVTVIEGAITGIVPGVAEVRVMKEMIAEGDPTNGIRV